jgi:hypothetical protein
VLELREPRDNFGHAIPNWAATATLNITQHEWTCAFVKTGKVRRQAQPYHGAQRSRSQEKSRPRNNRHPARNLHASRTQSPFPSQLNQIKPTEPVIATLTTIQNTDLDRQSLSYCVSLIENGVNPEALAVSLPPPLPLSSRSCLVRLFHVVIELTGAQKVIKELRARQESQEARLGA